MTNFVLIHNPLFGPSTWMPTAQALAKRGHNIALPALGPALSGPGPYYSKLGQTIADTARSMNDGVFLVAHGAGGTLVAAAAAACAAPVLGVIFVAASMPHPSRSWFAGAPNEIKDQFNALATNGRLPANNKMYPGQDEHLRKQVGDPAAYALLVTELVEIPLAYFEEIAPPNDPIKKVPIGYIQLSAADQASFDNAVWMKWKTRQEISEEGFPTITKPDRIATAIEAMAKDLRA